MPILTRQQSLDLSEVKTIVVTPVAQDGDTGEYVREVRIFGEPAAGDTGEPLLITVRLRARDRAKIHIAVPSLEF